MKSKRLIICTIGGIVAGIICSAGGYLTGNIQTFSFAAVAPAFFNRIMLGFLIGISGFKINYLVHGVLMGLLVSFMTSISFLGPELRGFMFFTAAGIIYGVLIELFATKVFRAAMA